MSTAKKSQKTKNWGGAYLVAAGILLSRLTGLVRMRALAHFLGNSDAADAFYAALKIPNFPQNLLGEGVLSASFIPVYANLVANKIDEEAGKVAGAILSLLGLIVSLVVGLGILLTPMMIDIIAPGFEGEKRELTIHLVQLIFPGTGVLVLSAWCLGVLNSHHKFFLSYVAPVISNFAVVLILLFFRNESSQNQLAIYASWGVVLGAIAQFTVQLPTTLKLIPHFKIGFFLKLQSVRTVIKNFVPVVISRGVVQLSAYIDSILASYLPSGAVSALGYAQAIYMLPISLFGMSVSAAELPSMSSAFGQENFYQTLQNRINSASQKIAFFVIPTVSAFLFLGDLISSLLFQTGKFDHQTAIYVWMVLAGSAVGLLASTLGRLYSSAFYSLRDTRTPLKFSVLRVFLTAGLGYAMGLWLPKYLGLSGEWGTAGLTASAGISGWVEFYLLRRKLNSIIGHSGIKTSMILKLWTAAIICSAAAYFLKQSTSVLSYWIQGLVCLSLFGIFYFVITALLQVPEALAILKRVKSMLRIK